MAIGQYNKYTTHFLLFYIKHLFCIQNQLYYGWHSEEDTEVVPHLDKSQLVGGSRW